VASWMGRSCTGRRPVQSLLLMSAAATLMTACGGVLRSEFPEVPGVQEIDLQWRPKAGMRLTCDASTTAEVATGFLPSERKRSETASKITLDIPTVGPDYFDFAITASQFPGTVTVRFSTKDWSLLRFAFDDGTGKKEIRLDEEAVVGLDRKKVDLQKLKAELQPIQDLLKQVSQFWGRWRVGELKPFEVRLPMQGGADAAFVLNSILRRVVLINGRAAAEFEQAGHGQMAFREASVSVEVTGTQWVDLLTGLSLRSVQKVTGAGTSQDEPRKIEIANEQTLDCTRSRL